MSIIQRDFIQSLTSLHIAAALGDDVAFRRLINESDYDVDVFSARQRTPLLMAFSSDQMDVIRLLVALVPV